MSDTCIDVNDNPAKKVESEPKKLSYIDTILMDAFKKMVIQIATITNSTSEKIWTSTINLNKVGSNQKYKRHKTLNLNHTKYYDFIYNILITIPNDVPAITSDAPPEYSKLSGDTTINNARDELKIYLEGGRYKLMDLIIGMNVIEIPINLLPYNELKLISNQDIDIKIEIGIYSPDARSRQHCAYDTVPYKWNDKYQIYNGVFKEY
jgi:hypothetical protein